MLGSLVTVYLILLGLAASLIVSTAQLATILPQYSEEMTNLLNEGRDKLADFGVSTEQIQSTLSSVDLTKVVGVLESGLEGLLGILSDLVFILALLLFMAFDGMSIRSRLHVLSEQRPEISYALSTFAAGTRKYLVVSTVFGLIVAVLDGGALCSWAFSCPSCGRCCPSSPTTSPTSVRHRRDSTGAPGTVAGRAVADAVGDRRLLRHQLRDPVHHPTQVRRRRRRTVGDDDVPLTCLLVVGSRGARSAAGDPALVVGEGRPARHRPATRWADILISGPRDMPKEEPEESEKPATPAD